MNDNINDSALVIGAPEVCDSLKSALAVAENAVAEQRRIEQALAVARGALREAEAELSDAQEKLAVAESGAAIGNIDVDKPARRRLLAGRDEAEFIRARVAGLEARLRTATMKTNEARRALAVEFRKWRLEQASVFIEQAYQPALDALLDAMRTLAAAGTALGVNRLLAIPRQAFVADPEDPVRNLANPKRLAWREDPESAALYDRLMALRRVIDQALGSDFADRVDDAA